MRTRRTKARLALACCLALLAGCGGGPNGGGPAAPDADKVIAEVSSFTDELMKAVETGADPSGSVAAAQKLLDSRKAALASDISALKRDPAFRNDQAARRKWLEAEVDNTTRVGGLKARLIEPAMRDPDFGRRLDKLVADYQDLFKD